VAPFAPTPENRWGIWITGSGEYANVGDDDDNAPGYSLTNGGVTLGLDYRLLHNLAIGVYFGYDQTTGDLVNDGHIKVNGGKVGGFATFFTGGFYVDVAGGGAWNNVDTNRAALGGADIDGIPLIGNAIGNTEDSELNVFGAMGYDWHLGCLNIGPVASFQYVNVRMREFTETGSIAPLIIHGQDEDALRSNVGMRATYDINVGSKGVIFRPELRASWMHEYGDQSYPIDASFIGCPGIFTVHGPTIGQDAVLIGAGTSIQLTRMFSVYAYYNGVFGRDNYDNHGGSGGFTLSF
jgi:outer membrane autotransporter protein